MTRSKMLGLAALASLMTMALVGASSAMAGSTSLCKVEESPCASGNRITHVHEVSLGHMILLSTVIDIECETLFLGDTLNSGIGSPLIIHGAFTYTCLDKCEAVEENGPAEIKVLRTASELASVTGEFLLHFLCSFINCRTNGVGQEAHGLGPLTSSMTNGSVELEEKSTNKESGFFCPSGLDLDLLTEPLVKTYIST